MKYLIALLIPLSLLLTGCSDVIATTSASSDCDSELEEANSEISDLKECLIDINQRLEDINSSAQDSAWADYRTMGEALDDIEYDSASFNIPLRCSGH